jgi:hypothetical protein
MVKKQNANPPAKFGYRSTQKKKTISTNRGQKPKQKIPQIAPTDKTFPPKIQENNNM